MDLGLLRFFLLLHLFHHLALHFFRIEGLHRAGEVVLGVGDDFDQYHGFSRADVLHHSKGRDLAGSPDIADALILLPMLAGERAGGVAERKECLAGRYSNGREIINFRRCEQCRMQRTQAKGGGTANMVACLVSYRYS